MKMHVLSGGRLQMSKRVYIPGAERGEKIELPVICVLLRHSQGNVLFDTGCHPSLAEDAEARIGGVAKAIVPLMPRGDHVVNSLKAVGLGPLDIDVVVNSHFHFDHCGCNEFFKQATIVVHAREIETARAANALAEGYYPQDWDHPMTVDAIEGERDLFGDGRIVLIPLPGHTPGSIGALAQLERDGAFLLVSDTVAVRENLDKGTAPGVTWNKDTLMKSYAEVRRIESGGATILCGHDDQQWATLRKGAHAYE